MDNGQKLIDIVFRYLHEPFGETIDKYTEAKSHEDLGFVKVAESKFREGLRKIHTVKLTRMEKNLFRPKELKEMFREAVKAMQAIDKGKYEEGAFRIKRVQNMAAAYNDRLRNIGGGF